MSEPKEIDPKKRLEIAFVEPAVVLDQQGMMPVAQALKTLADYHNRMGAKGMNAKGWGLKFTIEVDQDQIDEDDDDQD